MTDAHPHPAHHPAAEAAARVGPGVFATVLEPSPPAVTTGDLLADDPAAIDAAPDGAVVVTPTTAGDRSWADLVAEDPSLADWAGRRWLAARPPLPAVPTGYPAARDGYHRLAHAVVAEARRRVTARFGLRYTRAGFGTPFFGDDEQVRVENGRLVHQRAGTAMVAPITSLRAAADFLGIEPGTEAAEDDSPPRGDVDADLGATPETGAFLAAWFGLAWAALEELRLTPGATDVDVPQLWPGHFDPALAMGPPDAGARATYGFSPGDGDHDEPYAYVGPWGDVDDDDPFWSAAGFTGAELPFAELRAAPDPVAAAVAFMRAGHDRLTRGR